MLECFVFLKARLGLILISPKLRRIHLRLDCLNLLFYFFFRNHGVSLRYRSNLLYQKFVTNGNRPATASLHSATPKRKNVPCSFVFRRGGFFLKWKGHFSFWGSARKDIRAVWRGFNKDQLFGGTREARPTLLGLPCLFLQNWSHLPGSNWGPRLYERRALPTELRWLVSPVGLRPREPLARLALATSFLP